VTLPVPGGCPDWPALAAARDASPADPPGWEHALAHLDGCARCRRAAVTADPLLAFRRLPPLPVAGDEVEAMRLRVSALVGASGLAAASRGGLAEPRGRLASWLARRVPARSWRRLGRHGWAAAAAVVIALFAGAHGSPRGAAAPAAFDPSLAAELAAQPLLEELDRPFDNVVQWDDEELSVVLVVDPRFATGAGG
jgi:hypothetical protein